MRILVVDDETEVRDVFAEYLREFGHDPVLVSSAEAALEVVQTDPPDLIILDLFLPGMSGLAFLRLPSIRAAQIPVIVVSGVATETQARESLRLGAADFIGKPVRFWRLGEVLELLEPYTSPRAAGARAVPDRRRAPRAPLTVPVAVSEDDGSSWRGTSVTVSAFSVRVRPDAPVRAGRVVQLSFTPPDGGEALQLVGLLVREEPDGFVFFFADLSAPAVQRLGTLVERLQSG